MGSPRPVLRWPIRHAIEDPGVQAELLRTAIETTRSAIGDSGCGTVVLTVEFDYKDGVARSYRTGAQATAARKRLTVGGEWPKDA